MLRKESVKASLLSLHREIITESHKILRRVNDAIQEDNPKSLIERGIQSIEESSVGSFIRELGTRFEEITDPVPESAKTDDSPKAMYDFLRHSDNEGFRDYTYVPFDNDGTDQKSGVTIGAGYDLGSKTEKDLINDGFSKEDAAQLKRFLGKRGVDAKAELDKGREYVEEETLHSIGESHTAKSLERLEQILPNWENLSIGMKKIALSAFTQYGESTFKRQNLFKQLKANDVNAVRGNVNNWGDKTPKYGENINKRYKRYVDFLPQVIYDGYTGPDNKGRR